MDNSMINKIQKAKEYALQPERIKFLTLSLTFTGDNDTYQVDLGPEGWQCSCSGFGLYGICPHIMALEKIYKPMLSVHPLPYASGQNIVSDVKKAKRYSEELDRITINHFEAEFDGDNKVHIVSYNDGVWNSTSSYFKQHGIGAYTMTMERLLEGQVKPIRVETPQPE
ncbi:MAG: SWIM zinc finger family protein [Chloroflexota bacterium]